MDKKRGEGKDPSEKEKEGSVKFKPEAHQTQQFLTTDSSVLKRCCIPMGFKAATIFDNELAVGAWKGREKFGRWKRSATQS